MIGNKHRSHAAYYITLLDENLETVPAFLLAERFTGGAGGTPAQKEDAKSSLVAGETPAPPVGGLSRKTGDRH